MLKPYNISVQDSDMDRMNGLGVKCPVCESENVHTEKPTYQDDESGKDSNIIIPMWCEGVHHWNLVFNYHKGDTVVYLRDIEERLEKVTKIAYERA